MLFSKFFIVFATVALFATPICKGDIAEELTKRFNDNQMECVNGNEKRPAYECSGLIIRGVRDIQVPSVYPWTLSQNNKDKKSIPTAYLRKDTPFSRFPFYYHAGFIIHPQLQTPSSKSKCKVHCAFPLDAHTDGREGNGCGQISGDATGMSQRCDAQGITSTEGWYNHYINIMSSSHTNLVMRQCAFDMTSATATRDFSIVLEAKSHLQNSARYSFKNNELLIEAWNENNPKELPIETFWYLLDSHRAYREAKKYQDNYRKLTGEILPIVGIRLPTELNPNIFIEYNEGKHEHGHWGGRGPHHGGPHHFGPHHRGPHHRGPHHHGPHHHGPHHGPHFRGGRNFNHF